MQIFNIYARELRQQKLDRIFQKIALVAIVLLAVLTVVGHLI